MFNIDSFKDRKVQIIRNKETDSTIDNKIFENLNKLCLKTLFKTFYTFDKTSILNKYLPTLLFFSKRGYKNGINILNNSKIELDTCYNDPEEIAKSMSKENFHKLFLNKHYIPKTEFNKKDALTLNFPLIGKPSNGRSGLGIVKFDDKDILEKYTGDTLDIFCECIKDIKTEFRFIFLKETCFLVYERISINNKEVGKKNPDEKLEFIYIQQDLDTILTKYNIKDIVKGVRSKINLDFYALDIIVDNNNKPWLIETNSVIGMGAITLCKTYEVIYKDYFKEGITFDKKVFIENVYSEYNNEMKKVYSDIIQKSLHPIKELL